MSNESFDFSQFDRAINKDQFTKDYEDAKANSTDDYPEVPKGKYTVKIDKMEVRPTKTDNYPMFSVQCRIQDGQYKNSCIFFNRKIYGNKETDKWNDGKAVAGVVTWLDKLQTEIIPEFKSYTQFSECVLDIFDECEQYGLVLEVEYDPNAFNPIKILDVYEA